MNSESSKGMLMHGKKSSERCLQVYEIKDMSSVNDVL